jgi:indole-3-glycerol phosphate synthase
MTAAFYEALATASQPLIAEVKQKSPKFGDLMGDLSVAQVAQTYAQAGVPCLSVTTGRWHGGTPDMIATLAKTGLPVLRKDFIVSRAHLEQSRDLGAAAVLLTCTLLRHQDVFRLADVALTMGLTPFIEIASAQELLGLILPDEAILAINNRNIREQEMDDGGISRSLDLFAQARDQHRGLLISASGLLVPQDVHNVRQVGYDGVLVGTALLGSGVDLKDITRRFLEAADLTIEAI